MHVTLHTSLLLAMDSHTFWGKGPGGWDARQSKAAGTRQATEAQELISLDAQLRTLTSEAFPHLSPHHLSSAPKGWKGTVDSLSSGSLPGRSHYHPACHQTSLPKAQGSSRQGSWHTWPGGGQASAGAAGVASLRWGGRAGQFQAPDHLRGHWGQAYWRSLRSQSVSTG